VSFDQSVAGPADTGRACPYCRFPLKEGVAIVVCPVCSSAHHAECWRDNGGCAIVACAGGPGASGAPTVGETPTAPYSAASAGGTQQHGTAQIPPPPPPPSLGKRSPSLAIAVIVLALAVAGAAVAIVLGSQRGSTVRVSNVTTAQTVTVATTSSTPTTTTSEATTVSTATTPSGEGALPGVSGEQMRSEIEQMLLAWHEDVVHGEYRPAWNLLSNRKRVQDEREYGYGTWVKNQSTLRPYLNPANLQVSVERTEPASGVAQVDVTGMGWDKPGAPCTEWSGITWVKYEERAWRYDPGYSTTPQREREWKPRDSELLGGRC
jgi:hypothetical protein